MQGRASWTKYVSSSQQIPDPTTEDHTPWFNSRLPALQLLFGSRPLRQTWFQHSDIMQKIAELAVVVIDLCSILIKV